MLRGNKCFYWVVCLIHPACVPVQWGKVRLFRKESAVRMCNWNEDVHGEFCPKDGAIWDAIVAVPGVGVSIVNADGLVRYANPQVNQMLRGDGADDATGKYLHELFPRPYVEERLRIIRRVIETGQPVLLRHIRGGVQIESTIRPLCADPNCCRSVLVVSRVGESTPSPEFEVVESQYADLGELEVLSRRELEVLVLLGQGLSIAEIGKVLFRSPKTIEKHRASISRKLGVLSRAELARIVQQAGLELGDCGLKRYRLSATRVDASSN